MNIKRFEDLECWKEARYLAMKIYASIKNSDFRRDEVLSDEITGASVSIMDNICKGFDSGSDHDFSRFLSYSRRACSEVQNFLYIALDQKYIDRESFRAVYRRCEKLRSMIDSLISVLNNQKAIYRVK
ncbi:MAG TPA: four helix bundle protein [Desulfobacteraceae bacterium]|nr:four helix bundle protein [Desulfobacteraceae bacterium]